MTKFIMSIALLSTMLFYNTGLCCASQPVRLSVDSLFHLIDERNHTIKLEFLNVKGAEAGGDIARAGLLPHLSVSLSIGYLGNGYLTDRDFGHGMGIKNPHSNNNFAIEAMQTIYSGGAISGNIRLADLNTHIAKLFFKENTQQVRFLLLGWLVDLQCLQNRLRTIEKNITLAQQVLENMQARFKEGVILQNDITRYELQIQDLCLQRDKTSEAVRTINFRLANSLDLPTTTEFAPELALSGTGDGIMSYSEWQEQARTSNLSIQKADASISLNETRRRIITADKYPHLSLFAYGKFDSPIVTEVPVLNKNIMYWGFGATVSFNIASLYTTNRRIHQARIAEDASREAYDVSIRQVQDNVKSAYENYLTAVTELHTREKSLELARQNYTTVNNRFEDGMALVTDMVDAANVLLTAEIGVEDAQTMLLFCHYKLKYTTHTL